MIEQQHPEMAPAVTAQARYDELSTERKPYEQRARDAAELTIPTLLPPEGSSGATDFPTPFQSVGSRGVNNLAAKLLLALFPPGSSFFKLSIDEFVLDKLRAGGTEDALGEFQAALSKVERAIMRRIESKNTRSSLFETFKHLLVAGNALLQILDDGSFKFHPLTHYVVKRDLAGNPVEIVVKEALSRRTLPPEARAIVARKSQESREDPHKSIELYTWVSRGDDGRWKIHQEIMGEILPNSEGTYPEDKSAWLPLRWVAVPNEDYGRGYVEEYLGDLRSLEALSQALVDFAASAAKILWMVDPTASSIDVKTVQNAPSGAVVEGRADEITVMQMEKFADFRVAKDQSDEIKQRLEQAFMLTSSIQRNAERVTAEEIRIMAAELEQSLGGVYSVLAQELQRPLVVRVMFLMQKSDKLPHLPERAVSPQIVTGLEGLGRQTDYMRLQAFLAGLVQTFGPEAVREYVNVGGYATRSAASLSIDIKGLVRSEEEVQASRQQAMAAQMAEKLGPTAIKANTDRDLAASQAAQQEQAAASPQ